LEVDTVSSNDPAHHILIIMKLTLLVAQLAVAQHNSGMAHGATRPLTEGKKNRKNAAHYYS
jgi:hypothetical protein